MDEVIRAILCWRTINTFRVDEVIGDIMLGQSQTFRMDRNALTEKVAERSQGAPPDLRPPPAAWSKNANVGHQSAGCNAAGGVPHGHPGAQT